MSAGYRIALRPDVPGDDDPRSALDDVVVKDVEMFRAEDMGDHWWFCCYLAAPGGMAARMAFTLSKSDGVLRAFEFPEDYGLDVVYEAGSVGS